MKKRNSLLRFGSLVLTVSLLGAAFAGCGTKDQEAQVEENEKPVAVSASEEPASDDSDELQTITIGASGTDGSASDAARIAQQLGYFEEELEEVGYKPEYIGFAGAGPALNEALGGDSLDIALYGDLPAITAKSNGIDIKVFASYCTNYPFAVLASEQSGIASVTDLKGKKIAVGFGTVPYEYLSKLLEKNGLSITDVEIVNTSTDGPTMIASNQVDALVTADTAVRAYELQGLGKTLISSNDDEEISGLLVAVAKSQFLEEKRDAAVAVVRALDRAYEYAKADPDDTIDKLTSDLYSRELVALTYSDTGFEYFNPEVKDSVIKRIESTKQFMLDNKLIAKDIDVADLVDTTIYADK
ncbi:MAG: aliphatic sulfonate ABC transporter substrate-binding protein [Lachnospiraceae bacterium]|nr:aliphatic sulfonate ABC transporter substrate-binding protein [Lachnospiraceae bacterium]